MATVELSVDANLQGLRQQLESIPGLTAEQARLMTAELNKSIKASERAAKQAADASKKAMEQARASATSAGAAISDAGDAFGKAGSNSAKLAGALSMVSPAFGDAARNVADFADVGEVAAGVMGALGPMGAALTVGLGALAVAVPLVGEAMMDQTVESEGLLRMYERLEEATYNAAQAQRTYDAALSKVKSETQVILGLKTKERAATDAAIQAFKDQTQEQINAQQALIATATLTKAKAEEDIAAGATVSDRIALEQRLRSRMEEQDAIVRKAMATQKAAKAELETYIDVKEGELAATVAGTAATERKAKADKMAAASSKLKAAAEKEAEAAIKAAEQAVKDAEAEYTATQRRLEEAAAHRSAIEKEANAASVSSYEGYSAQLERLVPSKPLSDVEQLTILIADLDAAMLKAPTEELGMRFAALSASAVASLEEMKKAGEEAMSAEQWAAFFDQVNGYASGLFSNLEQVSAYFTEQANAKVEEAVAARKALGKDATDAEKKEAKERVQDAKKAAREQFEITKAMQMAQIIVNTAAAAAQALASAPPPFSFVAAAAALAAGGVQLATVQSTAPKFHKGGLIGQPDESMAMVRSGEAVLNPMGRSLLGDDTIRAANTGNLRGGDGGAVQIVYKHKAFDYFIRDHLRTRATLPRALGRGGRLGQAGG